jgi:hypothetical protein
MPSSIELTVARAAALRRLDVTPALHNLLCAVACAQHLHGHATTAGVADRLGCTRNAVQLQLFKNPDLFHLAGDGLFAPRRLTLTGEGISLMAKIAAKTTLYVTQPHHTTSG